MDPHTPIPRDGRIFAVRRLSLRRRYLHCDYKITAPKQPAMGSTGEFVLFRILHRKRPFDRGFVVRWDNKAARIGSRAPAVKVDLENASPEDLKAFKHGDQGYAGHWTKRRTNQGFDLKIKDRGTLVFKGTLGLLVESHADLSVVPAHEIQLVRKRDDGVEGGRCTLENILPLFLCAAHVRKFRESLIVSVGDLGFPKRRRRRRAVRLDKMPTSCQQCRSVRASSAELLATLPRRQGLR